MKVKRIVCIVFFVAAFGISVLGAQSSPSSSDTPSLKGMSASGSTGLFSIPSARIGWERSSDFGLDFGYHAIIKDKKATHIPKLAASLFKFLELNVAFDIQPDGIHTPDKGTDFITGAKIQFPVKKTALALGGNFQALNMANSGHYRYNAGQVYLAVTYAGNFFDMPAETTVVLGKTFREPVDSNIDFGMGFDLVLLPKYLERIVHWVTDFSNFSYSVEPFSANAWYRGTLNTGFRIDLSAIPALSKFKFALDILMTDAFDKERAFSVGGVFGIPIL